MSGGLGGLTLTASSTATRLNANLTTPDQRLKYLSYL
jgi:hypothetical protein